MTTTTETRPIRSLDEHHARRQREIEAGAKAAASMRWTVPWDRLDPMRQAMAMRMSEVVIAAAKGAV